MKNILPLSILLFAVNAWSQTSVGLNAGLAINGADIGILLRQKNERIYWQAGIGTLLHYYKMEPKFTAHAQCGLAFKKNKKLFWVNELNFINGINLTSGIYHGGSYIGVYSIAKMALTYNTGFEYVMLSKNKINLSTSIKLGIGKGRLNSGGRPCSCPPAARRT